MFVHKPKFKNIPTETPDWFIRHHVPYERWMMRESLKAALNGAQFRFQQNLHVEGLALHARNLIEFLKNGESCGFNPRDFTTEAFSVDRKFIRGELVEKINTQIGHLTPKRTEKQQGKFDERDWRETTGAVEKELNRWIEHLKLEWALKWKERERMGDDEGGVLEVAGHFTGACSAPTSSRTPEGGESTPQRASVT